jgi:hypothetical protein
MTTQSSINPFIHNGIETQLARIPKTTRHVYTLELSRVNSNHYMMLTSGHSVNISVVNKDAHCKIYNETKEICKCLIKLHISVPLQTNL